MPLHEKKKASNGSYFFTVLSPRVSLCLFSSDVQFGICYGRNDVAYLSHVHIPMQSVTSLSGKPQAHILNVWPHPSLPFKRSYIYEYLTRHCHFNERLINVKKNYNNMHDTCTWCMSAFNTKKGMLIIAYIFSYRKWFEL